MESWEEVETLRGAISLLGQDNSIHSPSAFYSIYIERRGMVTEFEKVNAGSKAKAASVPTYIHERGNRAFPLGRLRIDEGLSSPLSTWSYIVVVIRTI